MKPIPLILDTDLGCDCDDAGAMAVMHRLADLGKCKILAVTHCTSRLSGIQSVDAINRYFGRGEIPVGTWLQPGFLDDESYEKFTGEIAQRFAHQFRDGTKPQDAVQVLRRALAKAEDKSVVIAAIGPLKNISQLLQSSPDESSEQAGRELVAQKVKKLCVMGGHFPETSFEVWWGKTKMEAEWNILQDVKAAQNVAENWPSSIVYVPYEIGFRIITGKLLMAKSDPSSPIYLAYKLFNNGPRESWDQVTVLYAVEGEKLLFRMSPMGRIHFDPCGVSHFEPDGEGTAQYMLPPPPDGVTELIENLML